MSQHIAESLLRSFRDPGSLLVRRLTYPILAPIAIPGRKKYTNLFDKTQIMSAESMRKHQSTLLRALLLHAYRNVPFYRESMENTGITPLDIQTPEDLVRLQPLSHWHIEHRHDDLTACNLRKSPEKPTTEFFTYARRQRAVKAALLDRYRQNAGLYPWMRYASMGEREDPGPARTGIGVFASVAETVVNRRIQFDISGDRENALRNFLPLLRKYQPEHLAGTAELVSEFAQHCRQTGIGDIAFKGVLIEEGSITNECRELVESVFRSRVFLKYGCERIPHIAWQCNEHEGLHLNEDAMIVELDPLPGSPSGHGRLLVTDLFNYTMPLIRFEVGSVAQCCGTDRCRCGCTLGQLASIEESVAEYRSRRRSDLPSNSKFVSAPGAGRESGTADRQPDKKWIN